MTSSSDGDPVAWIVGNSSAQLWGLDGRERLRRQLHAIGIAQILVDGDPLPAGAPTLLLRGDFLFDERTLRALAKAPNTILLASSPQRHPDPAAAHVASEAAQLACAVLNGTAAPETLSGATVQTPATLSSAYLGALRKSAPPLLLPIRAERAAALERYLFDGSYKGVTDLVTKWVWPTPARWVTHLCVRLGIRPNAVTTASLVLVIVATLLFANGRFSAGLLVAWIMTFLDTVDGKLARVTVTSTRFGHIFDHGIDLIHPPLWYVAWGYGVVGTGTADIHALQSTFVAIVAGYVVGRLVEGSFSLIGGFSVFTWRPLDSYFRLVAARRNPNLLLLSFFGLVSLPLWGLIAVSYWTVLSSAFLLVRLGQAAYARVRHGRLRSWLEDLSDDVVEAPAYARPFTPGGVVSGLVS
jgi:phosphatidylglycerophosphate synthase